jgi:hypothetical protein
MNEHLQHNEATAGDAVLAFCKQHLNNTFTADELRLYVAEHITGTVSPSTADRVLRNLRIKGQVEYVVLNRGKSLYKVTAVEQWVVEVQIKDLSQGWVWIPSGNRGLHGVVFPSEEKANKAIEMYGSEPIVYRAVRK